MGELSFAGRVALVTGAGSGLGRTYALELGRRGCKVVVNDYGGVSVGRRADNVPKTTEKAQVVVDQIKAAGGEAVADGANVVEYEAVGKMVALAESTWGRLDIVICNAGISRDRDIEKMDEQDYDTTFGVHCKGAFNVVRHAWPLMQRQKYGRILLTSSGASFGDTPPFHAFLYGGAKAAMIGMVKNLRHEGKAWGIQANALMPGAFTAMSDGLNKGASDEARKKAATTQPPEHVTPAALFMCHESCRDSGEVVSAEMGAYSTARLVKGPLVRAADNTKPQSLEWVRDNWDKILALSSNGEAVISADFYEMDGTFRKAKPVPFGRRGDNSKSKL